MSRRSQAAVLPAEVDSQERGLHLLKREDATPELPEDPGLHPATLEAFRARIAALKAARPQPGPSCVACFHRGADAALAGVEAEKGRIHALRERHPIDARPHDAESFRRGVDAALDAMEA